MYMYIVTHLNNKRTHKHTCIHTYTHSLTHTHTHTHYHSLVLKARHYNIGLPEQALGWFLPCSLVSRPSQLFNVTHTPEFSTLKSWEGLGMRLGFS